MLKNTYAPVKSLLQKFILEHHVPQIMLLPPPCPECSYPDEDEFGSNSEEDEEGWYHVQRNAPRWDDEVRRGRANRQAQ